MKKMVRKRRPQRNTSGCNACRINRQQYSAVSWFTVIAFLYQICLTNAQFDNFNAAAVECPSDSSLAGYTSIEAINGDIDKEITRIQGGGMPQEMYTLVLCPGTFDTSTTPLLPRLDQASYSCAGNGDVNAGCIFSGGEVNIRIEDPEIDGYFINAINFLGITFTGFTGYSIELLGSAPAEAIFMNCLWQDFSADGIASIDNDNDPPMDLKLDMCAIQSSTGDTADAVVDVAFDNNGGAMLLVSVLVEGIQVDGSFVQTLDNGASMVFESTFMSNSLARLSETASGMTDFTGVTISENKDIVRMFEADGEGSSTLVENSVIERNIGESAYQIFRITDGAEGSLLNSTIRFNNPVEYGVYVLAETEGTTPTGLVEDTMFDSNLQQDWALVMSEGVGAFAELSRNQFVNNTGGIMNIGAFFGGDIRFTQNCFIGNTHFLVALILEFSEFEAFENYVEDEVSQVCSGEDSEQGPGRLSVEQPGSMCFRGGDSCDVDCLPNINDSPVCLADAGSPMPTVTQSLPSPAPTKAPTKAPTQTASPTERPVPTDPPSPGNPTNPPATIPTAPFFPTSQPIAIPTVTPMPICPSCMQSPMPVCPLCMQPSPPVPSPTRRPTRPPSGPSKPKVHPPFGHSKPSVVPTTYRPPHHGCKYYGIGDGGCSDHSKHYKKPKSEKYHASQAPPNKEPKYPGYPSYKDHKSSKASKSRSSSDDGYYPSHPQQKYPQHPQHYSIDGAGPGGHSSHSQSYEKSQFGIGYSYAQPRTGDSAAKTAANQHGIGHKTAVTTGRAGETERNYESGEEEHQYGIGHIKKAEKKGEKEQ